MEHNRGFLEKLDTSNYPVNHPCYRTERCKIPGTFTDETGGEFISAHVALRSKAYGFIQNTKEIIKAKGVAHHAVKNHIIFENYKQCLFQGIIDLPEDYTPYREMRSFRSYKHQIKSIDSTKLALNRYDDKRVVLKDQIHTLAHGHYKIESLKNQGGLANFCI
ncbi:uncharacterized protein LOC126909567 [Daktulosphaira vitifoliae]|uniref:uncharacterized protein LOC126909567 n=1 Tax=Daktulosphaira vitifoliae TaxID=58002 RepID=UPI0021A9CF11|nr:uncharacterized protein LOC126909567 [Daktulosphaira vitifoliae]